MPNRVPANILAEKFDFEMMKRGRNGCITLIAVAASLMYFNWIPNSEKLFLKPSMISGAVILSNLWRIWAMDRVLKFGVLSSSQLINKIKFITLVSPLLFGALFAEVLLLDQFRSSASFLSFLITVGMGVGSVLSLAPALTTAIFFQVLLIVPIFAVGVQLLIRDQNDQAFLLISCIAMFLIFNTIQIRMIRKLLQETISSFYWLEQSKIALEASEIKLKEESVKVIQSSRLASLGEMAGGVAHEINNPLAVISASREIIFKFLTRDGSVVDEGVWNKLEKIRNATLRIQKIVMGLRSFSQQGDNLPSEVATVGHVLNETLEFCNERMKTEGIDFSVVGPLDSLIQVRPIQISQIILNLINNSIDEVRGKEQAKILVSVAVLATEVRVEVTDSGTGVAAHILERLFNPFVTSKDIGKGTGLGLSVSRGLARAHGGDLEYIPTEANTTFRLSLPKHTDAPLEDGKSSKKSA